MSPEVVFKKPYNENIDVWSLGVLLYELLHGKSAFKARNLNEITTKLKRPIELPFDEKLSEDVKDLIKGILRLEASDRLSLKQMFENKWIKKMYIDTDFENYEKRMRINNIRRKENASKEINKSLPYFQNAEKTLKQKSFRYCRVNLEVEEKPFQQISRVEKENYKENKKLYSFQALENASKETTPSKGKNKIYNEKENVKEKENSYILRRKIFEMKNKKESPDRILKSMENLIMDFELKLNHEKEYISSALFKKKYDDIK